MTQTTIPMKDYTVEEIDEALIAWGYDRTALAAWCRSEFNIKGEKALAEAVRRHNNEPYPKRFLVNEFKKFHQKRESFDTFVADAEDAPPAGPPPDEQQQAITISQQVAPQQIIEGDFTVQAIKGIFSDVQIDALEAPLDKRLVKSRPVGGGRQASYLTGATVVDTANFIFGYGMWGYEPRGDYTYKELPERQLYDKDRKPTRMAREVYIARDITVWVIGANGERSEATDRGAAVADLNAADPFGEMEKAEKGVITDGVKRGLVRFGSRFGNDLRNK